MIIITATIPTTPANRKDIVELCSEHSARSRTEPSCISHQIHADCEDPARLFFYEEWEDEAAVAAHFAVPESGEFVKRLTAMVGERPEIRIYRAEAAGIDDLG